MAEPKKDPRELIAEIMAENPEADESEIKALFLSALKTSPDFDEYVRAIIKNVFHDIISKERKLN